MSNPAPAHNRRRRRVDRHVDAHNDDERWLLTYSDMITLLMALFIIMWAISSVNTSKFAALRQSMKDAFAGKLTQGGDGILNGGKQVLEPEGARVQHRQTVQDPTKVLAEKFQDAQHLQQLAQQMNAYAQAHGLQGQMQASVDERGVLVRLLTDKVLFDPGEATIKAPAVPLLHQISLLIRHLEIGNPIRVEGNTDSTPIHTAQFQSNWELSTARATAVLQVLLAGGVAPHQLSAAGYADQRPVATNATADGRYHNRHVDIIVLRNSPPAPGGSP